MSDTKSVLVIDGNVVGDVFQNATDDYVEVTSDGVKTWVTILNDIYSKINQDKLNVNGYIEASNSNGKVRYSIYRIMSDTIFLTYAKTNASYLYSETIEAKVSNSKFYAYYQGSGNDWSSQPVSSGYVRFYYGNKTSQVDLTTYANKCMMSDGESVEQSISGQQIDLGQYLNTDAFNNNNPNLLKAYKTGNIIVLNICGISAKAAGNAQTLFRLPDNFIKGYASITVFTDASSSSAGNCAGVYTDGTNRIRCHVPSSTGTNNLWGQMIVQAGSYFD